MRLTCLLFTLVACSYSQSFPLDSTDGLKPVRLNAEAASYNGKKALKVTEPPNAKGEDRYVMLPVTDFQDGTIEAEMTGRPASALGAMAGARGFVGIAFRIVPDPSQFEMFYLRPTNGRADDQVRRNHSSQYVSFPDFPWMRMRKEFPEKYEAYIDLVPAEWTKVKIEVKGATAKLFVHGNQQPTLIVNDLKHNVSKGGVGLWIGPGTEAHFANVKITK